MSCCERQSPLNFLAKRQAFARIFYYNSDIDLACFSAAFADLLLREHDSALRSVVWLPSLVERFVLGASQKTTFKSACPLTPLVALESFLFPSNLSLFNRSTGLRKIWPSDWWCFWPGWVVEFWKGFDSSVRLISLGWSARNVSQLDGDNF